MAIKLEPAFSAGNEESLMAAGNVKQGRSLVTSVETAITSIMREEVEVDDMGQVRVSSTWVLWDKGEEVICMLVVRGFEEDCLLQTDSQISKMHLKSPSCSCQ